MGFETSPVIESRGPFNCLVVSNRLIALPSYVGTGLCGIVIDADAAVKSVVERMFD